jgi:thymidylate kinase
VIVVAIEGYDGSGKTTLVRNLATRLTNDNLRCAEVGRTTKNSSEHVAKMTNVIKGSDGGQDALPSMADMHLRLARLHARIGLITALDADIVLLDRFMLYDLSRIPEDLRERHRALFEEVAETLLVDLTLHLTADFDLLWNRVTNRHVDEISPKERLGYEHNRNAYMKFSEVLTSQSFYRNVHEIDCRQSIETVADIAWQWVRSTRGVN